MKITYEVPVSDPTEKKRAFLESLTDKYPKMVQWFLTVFEKEGLDLRDESLNGARIIIKEMTYSTEEDSPVPAV